MIARILLGLIFFVSGLNGFLNFLPMPKDAMPAQTMAFGGALSDTGYMMALVSGTQLVVGALLLINVFVPLALALIAPVIANIIAFHVFLAPAGMVPGIVVTILEIYLAWVYRNTFRAMLMWRARPVS